jgi:hypothetical protein
LPSGIRSIRSIRSIVSGSPSTGFRRASTGIGWSGPPLQFHSAGVVRWLVVLMARFVGRWTLRRRTRTRPRTRTRRTARRTTWRLAWRTP